MWCVGLSHGPQTRADHWTSRCVRMTVALGASAVGCEGLPSAVLPLVGFGYWWLLILSSEIKVQTPRGDDLIGPVWVRCPEPGESRARMRLLGPHCHDRCSFWRSRNKRVLEVPLQWGIKYLMCVIAGSSSSHAVVFFQTALCQCVLRIWSHASRETALLA